MNQRGVETRTRVLLIGCGEVSNAYHLPALRVLRDEGLVDVVACDTNAGRARAAGDRFGFETSTDWSAAADNADAVIVTVPPGPNADIAAHAASRGLHVLCEKPPGRDVAQAQAMAAAATARPEIVTM